MKCPHRDLKRGHFVTFAAGVARLPNWARSDEEYTVGVEVLICVACGHWGAVGRAAPFDPCSAWLSVEVVAAMFAQDAGATERRCADLLAAEFSFDLQRGYHDAAHDVVDERSHRPIEAIGWLMYHFDADGTVPSIDTPELVQDDATPERIPAPYVLAGIDQGEPEPAAEVELVDVDHGGES